jgi:hypothetical protein
VLKRGGVHLCDVEVAENDGHCNFNQGSDATMRGITMIDLLVGLSGVSRKSYMKQRAHGSTMELCAQGCIGDEYRVSIEAVIEEGVNAEDDLIEVILEEAPHLVCLVRRHVGEIGTRLCCQHRACIE